MNLSRPDRVDLLDALAGAYVLGTLPARPRSRLARMARTDTVIAAALRGWEERLLPLAEDAPPVTPSPRVWKVIALRLGLDPERITGQGPWWTRMRVWRAAAVASFATAFVFGLALIAPRPGLPDQSLVVVLAAPDSQPALIATMRRGERAILVKVLGAAPVPPGQTLELWMLPEGSAPRSLGVLPATGLGHAELPDVPSVALVHVPALAVSLEQAGGSPTGAPQGPMLYSGRIERMF